MSVILEYKKYHATIDYDPKDKIFIGNVTGIKDSLNFHARSATEARKMFEESVDNYLDACGKMGKEPEKGEGVK